MSGLTDTQVDAIASAATSLVAALRAVVDTEAHGEPSPSPTGTSSAGGSGQRPPAAPSTETRQAAQDGQSGSGGDAMDGVPAHQPTPQVGDVYESTRLLGRYRLVRIELDGWYPHHVESVDAVDGGDGHDQRIVDLDNTDDRFARWTLVERDGKPWPPTQEPDPVAVEPATDERPEVLPADDDDLAVVEDTNVPVRHQFDWNNWFVACVVARLRQEQAIASDYRGAFHSISAEAVVYRHERDEARRERDEAVARAEKLDEVLHSERDRANRAEAALARVERVTAAERAVIDAAEQYADGHPVDEGNKQGCLLICPAVRALRDAQEEGQ